MQKDNHLDDVEQGLSCCIKVDGKRYPFCERCPYKEAESGTCSTVRVLMADALSEIQRQKKHIEELEELLYQGGCDGLNACSVMSCPYYNASHVRMEETKAAIILGLQTENEKLTAKINDLQTVQTPRVMTLEEVKQWNRLKRNEKQPVYIENINDPDKIWAYDGDFRVSFCSYKLANGYVYDGYGFSWRCWTFRPTRKQRDETPWES